MSNSLLPKGVLAGFMIAFSACTHEAIEDPSAYTPRLPANFPAPAYDLAAHPPSAEAVALGKRLFYDPILSKDSTVSCASCHDQSAAFADPGQVVSRGIGGQLGRRNTPALQNLMWQRAFFWDGGVPHLDRVPWNPIANPLEMAETPVNIVAKLNRDPEYRVLFRRAYGVQTISGAEFLDAMAQFMALLVSAETPYDRHARGESGVLSAEALAGLETFRQKCGSCHTGDLFTDDAFRNNGLYQPGISTDHGRYETSLIDSERGKFKTPTLRNIALTAPYMHDGSLPTLEAVLEHYAAGVHDAPSLDPALRRPDGTLGISLSEKEKTDILAFLNTLTDEGFTRDPRFSFN